MSQKLRFIGLAAIISIFAANTALASFQDVSTTHVNSDAIDYMQKNKIVEGYPDGSYQPDRTINRAEFTKIIVGAYFDEKDISNCKTSTLKFKDTDPKAWYAPFVCMAVEKSIIQGYPDNTFKPAQEISFVEAAKIVYIANNAKTLSDKTWYKPYVEELEKSKAIPNTISKFEHQVTRGEMAEVVYRLKANITNKESLTYAKLESSTSSSSNSSSNNSSSSSSSNSSNSTSTPTNQFEADAAKLGDKVGGFTVSQISKRPNVTEFTFEGEVDVTGTYTHLDSNDKSIYAGMICMDQLTDESKAKIPTLNAKNDVFFCFTNKEFAEKNLAPEGSSGTATVTIDEYTVNAVGAGDPVDSAQLVKVIVKQEKKAATPANNQSGTIADPAVQKVVDYETAKVGDKVGDFSISSISAPDAGALLSDKNVEIEFAGEITLSGVAELKPAIAHPSTGHICISGFNLDEINKLPLLKGTDLNTVEVCLSNTEFAKQSIPKHTEKRYVRVKVKNYTITANKDFHTHFAELTKVEVDLELPKLLENVNSGLRLKEDNQTLELIDPNQLSVPLQQ